jgi:tRNA U34 2-thiouridine synthase MnmA/TrmU
MPACVDAKLTRPPSQKGTRLREKAKGIGLLSGGLDSAIACMLLKDAGAEVECLHFFTGFCVTGHNSRVGRKDRPIANHALQVAADLAVPVELVDIAEEYLPVVLSPKFGYGKNMNPCLDCRIFMLKKAKAHMEKVGADFVFTGEVLGQRPMSQLKRAMRTIDEEVGLDKRLLRPLSAGLLPPTRVESEGRVDRSKLLSIHGRGRKMQIRLARQYGLSSFMQPAGGCCFLTDQAYSNKFKDIIAHNHDGDLDLEDVFVLGVGRHFRLSPELKIIVGRNETENNFLSHYAGGHWCAKVVGFTGPTAVVLGQLPDDPATVASVVARYSDGKDEFEVDVKFTLGDRERCVTVHPASEELLTKHRI